MWLRRKIAIALIAIPFLVSIPTSVSLIRFEQEREPDRRTEVYYSQYVRENGYERLTIALLVLSVLAIPFRRCERWAWLVLALVLVLNILPVFVLSWPLPGWQILKTGAVEHDWFAWLATRTIGMEQAHFDRLLFTFLITSGLILTVPELIRSPRAKDASKDS